MIHVQYVASGAASAVNLSRQLCFIQQCRSHMGLVSVCGWLLISSQAFMKNELLFPELWVLCRCRPVRRYKSQGGTTPHEPCCRISRCHPPNLSDKPANFPITSGAIHYHQASQHLKGIQEGRVVRCMLTIPWSASIELFHTSMDTHGHKRLLVDPHVMAR